MGAGIAVLFKTVFGADKLRLESPSFKGDYNKLGQIDYGSITVGKDYIHKIGSVQEEMVEAKKIMVVNCYTQYHYGGQIPLDYDALRLCMRKLNHTFKGKHILSPKIGCGLAGGDWNVVKEIIKKELKDCNITIVTL